MKTLFISLIALFAFVLSAISDDTSYLLVEGPFGSGGTLETHKWKVNYPSDFLTSGLDLLTAVFGPPVDNGTYTDSFGFTNPYFSAGNSQQGVNYIQFSSGFFVESFTLNSTTVAQDTDFDPFWNYSVAGGGGTNGKDNMGAPYPAGMWGSSNDGIGTRMIVNDSFDGWSFGSFETGITGSDPLAANFADATVIFVPEPSTALLVLIGAVCWALRRKP